jgi:hypothetical protein
MHVLQIEHPVRQYEAWKQAFDADPVGREAAGVRRYRIERPIDDPAYVMIDLEFDDTGHAEAMLASLRELWGSVQGTLIGDPRVRIVELVESREYCGQSGPGVG